MLSKMLLTISLILVGCTTAPVLPPETVVTTEFVKQDCGTPPQRDPIDLKTISWQIVGGLFTLTPEGYEDLSYNVTEIWKGVEQLNTEIAYYEACTQTD